MRIVHVDRKRSLVEVVPEDREDLWLLSLLIEPGDVVEGVVRRRIKREDERGSGKVFTFRVKLGVDEAEFTGSSLRIKGKVVEGPEDLVGRGKHQGMEIREGEKLRVFKETWSEKIVEELKTAERLSKHPPILIVSLSDETAALAVFERRIGPVKFVRRRGDEESLRVFFGEVARELEGYPADRVVVGGPKVIVDEFKKFLEEKGTEKKITFVVSPLSGEKGIRDIVSKRAVSIIADERRREVEERIDEFLVHLSRGDGLASLNPEEDASMGNVEVLLVHEEWVRENRKDAHRLMKAVHDSGGKVYLVTSDMEKEGIVRKLGGRIAIRRFSYG